MQIFVNPKYNFLRWRYPALAISAVFVLIGLAVFLTRGTPHLGIDFSGGASVVLKFQGQPPLQELRGSLRDATIQQYGKPAENSLLIRLPQQQREGDYAGQVVQQLHATMNPQAASKHDLNFHGSERLATHLKQADPDVKGTNPAAQQYYNDLADRIIARRSQLGIFSNMNEVTSVPGVTTATAKVLNEQTIIGRFNVLSQETVGPQVGSELQTKAIWAIVLSVLGMGAYIWMRFDLKFGVAAVLCLVHDVAVTLAFLTMLPGAEFEILTVAALLMVVGYSINDKVVIYDRVRENLRKSGPKAEFETVLNESLNQSLSRTILTGGCVILVLVALIILGGPVLNEFAWILLVGTIAGTYSTVTIAPLIVIAWNRYRGRNRSAAVPMRAEAPRSEEQSRKRKVS
jgi:preprotein translocase SecF subunit